MASKPLPGIWVYASVNGQHAPNYSVTTDMIVGAKNAPPPSIKNTTPVMSRFFTNESIRTAIRQSQIKPGFALGDIRMIVNAGTHAVEIDNYFPLDNIPLSWKLLDFVARRKAKMRRAGIAQLAEYISLNFIRQTFPDVHEIQIREPSERLREHLFKRGHVMAWESKVVAYPLEQGLALLREKIARDMWEHVTPATYSKRSTLPRSQWTHDKLVRRRKVA